MKAVLVCSSAMILLSLYGFERLRPFDEFKFNRAWAIIRKQLGTNDSDNLIAQLALSLIER